MTLTEKKLCVTGNRKIASDEVWPMDDQWMTNDRKIQRPFGLRKILQEGQKKKITSHNITTQCRI